MSRTNDAVFHKEFRDMMNGRKALTNNFNLVDLPLPPLKSMIKGSLKGHMVVVKNIKEPFFERLNTEEVQLVGKTTLQKRQVLPDGTFRKDASDNYVTMQVPVPHSHVAILSPTSIGLKRFVEENGVKVEHKVQEGFRYVDYVETKQGRKYIYIIPKQYAFRLNMCALVITPNKRRTFFQGCKLALQNGNYVYLYVTPFKYRENMDLRVLGVKSNYNFNQEVTEIIRFWMQLGVLFDLNLTALEGNINGVENLGIMDIEGTIISEDYRRYAVSMLEEKEEDFNNSLDVL